jgi:hypothetical protein
VKSRELARQAADAGSKNDDRSLAAGARAIGACNRETPSKEESEARHAAATRRSEGCNTETIEREKPLALTCMPDSVSL